MEVYGKARLIDEDAGLCVPSTHGFTRGSSILIRLACVVLRTIIFPSDFSGELPGIPHSNSDNEFVNDSKDS